MQPFSHQRWRVKSAAQLLLLLSPYNARRAATLPKPPENQVHYDGQHAVFDEFLLTVSTRRCPLCSQVFVYSSDAKTHQCPSKIHTLDDLSKAGSATRSWTRPHFDMDNLTGWVLYVDGSGPHDSIVSAGWGVAIWSLKLGQLGTGVRVVWACSAQVLG